MVNIVKQSVKLDQEIRADEAYKRIERAGRTAYKSESSGDHEATLRFIRSLISRGHESVLEHISVSVRIVTDRAIANELVRHRIASYTQESTRYCNYNQRGFSVILPENLSGDKHLDDVIKVLQQIEATYNTLVNAHMKPEMARAILPLCLKTEIVATMNIREWRHVLKLRLDTHAHPQMRELAGLILRALSDALPILFEDISEV
ncbi:FAD-dependent thymidylate synthase [Dehalococcoides mccartyi]|uniref:FAD-dependent thymidylate synthase n=1 Tax=Dehalococcoides mccartyi TaxID=61435 RepID=UPI000ABBB28B|nr:FAD-dependent thymidylate synthase [Dehalococcoides mccartyi]